MKPAGNDSARPGIELDFRVHWCPRHLEPCRAEWPKGAGVAMVKLLDAALADDELTARAPLLADGKRDAHALNAVLLEHSPLCCWLGEGRMAEVYRQVEEIVGSGGQQ